MVVVVLAPEVVNVRGADQRAPELPGDPDHSLVRSLLLGKAVLLQLEVDVLGTEGLHQLIRVRPRVRGPSLQQVLAEARLKAACKRDHPLPVRRQLLEVYRRLASLKTLQKAPRAQLDEVPVPGGRLRQQREVKAIQPSRRPPLVVLDQVHLAADDRLDPLPPAGGEQLHGAVHHAVIGESQRRLAKRRGPGRQGVDFARAVQ